MKRSLKDPKGQSRLGRLAGLVRRWTGDHRGFSMPEMLMAVMIMGVIAGTTIQLMSAAKVRVDRGSEEIELEQQARQAVELLVNDVRHAGLAIFINNGSDASDTRQHAILEASPHRLAFYSDTNPRWYSPMTSGDDSVTWMYGTPPASGPSMSPSADAGDGDEGDGFEMVRFPNVYRVSFPDGEDANDAAEYFGHIGDMLDDEPPQIIPEYLKRDAEIVLYTMDTDEDGRFTGADEDMFEAGATPNPADAVLRRYVFYTRLEGTAPVAETATMTVARGLRVIFDGDDPQPPPKAGVKFPPPFIYYVSETYSYFDINGDGDTRDEFLFGDCHADPDADNVCGDDKLGPKEMDSLTAMSKYARTDLADNLHVDTRFDNVLTRIVDEVRLPGGGAMSEADARQYLRNMISRIQVNLLIESSDARPGVVHPTWSTPEKPYRYVQHEVRATAYLPNAFFVSKNQLLASEWVRDTTTNDANHVVDGSDVYNPADCTWPTDATPCWPTSPGGGRDGDPNDVGTPGNGSGGGGGGQANGNECGGRVGEGCGGGTGGTTNGKGNG